MNTSALNYIPILDSETITLGQLLSQSVRSATLITLHSASIYLESKQLLHEVQREAQTSRTLMDADQKLVERLGAIQEKIKSLYHQLGNDLFVCRVLLKKAFNHFGLIIININEHDVDADDLPLSGPFDSVDELMHHLNS